MKIQKIINTYCRIYGVKSPKVDLITKECIVTISADGSRVIHLDEPSKLLGQIVGNALKRGMVLYVHNDQMTSITWENWKGIWNKLFAPKPRKNSAPEPNALLPEKFEIYDEMRQKGARKKPAKRGFERTYNANTAMNLLGTPTFKRTRIA